MKRIAKEPEMAQDADQGLTRAQAAELIGVTSHYLANVACRGEGPPFRKTKAGRHGKVLYIKSEVLEWLRSCPSTEEPPAMRSRGDRFSECELDPKILRLIEWALSGQPETGPMPEGAEGILVGQCRAELFETCEGVRAFGPSAAESFRRDYGLPEELTHQPEGIVTAVEAPRFADGIAEMLLETPTVGKKDWRDVEWSTREDLLSHVRRLRRSRKTESYKPLLHEPHDQNPSPHAEQMNASIAENPGNMFSAPQWVQRALQIVSACASSSMTRSASSDATVRTTTPHSLHTIPSPNSPQSNNLLQPL
jgi:hypothetical protein